MSTGALGSTGPLAGSGPPPGPGASVGSASLHRRQNSATHHPYMPSLSDEAPASVAIVDVGHGRAVARGAAEAPLTV